MSLLALVWLFSTGCDNSDEHRSCVSDCSTTWAQCDESDSCCADASDYGESCTEGCEWEASECLTTCDEAAGVEKDNSTMDCIVDTCMLSLYICHAHCACTDENSCSVDWCNDAFEGCALGCIES